MKLKAILLPLALCLWSVALAQSSSNYATEAATVLVEQGNNLFNKGKYEEAKVLYERALATGDKFFEKKCQEQLDLINKRLAARKAPATVFTVSQDNVVISYPAQEYPLYVNGSNWRATADEAGDWCDIQVDRKHGMVIIKTKSNDTPESRIATITVTNGNGQKKTVRVTKEGAPEVLRSSAHSLMFTPEGETNVVDIDANTDWSVTDVPEWLKAVKGLDDIRFTASANDQNTDRIAQVKVETPGNRQIVINVIQAAGLDSLAFSKNDLQFGPDGGDEYVHVHTDADDWRFGDFPHWCQLKRIDNTTILVHCTPNEPVDMPRQASINVTTGTQTLGINVSQAPKPIVHLIPVDGVGGRRLSFGFSAGYVMPMISATSSSTVYGAVNYALPGNEGQAGYSAAGGFSIGAFADLRLYKNLYLKAGLEFMYYKYKNDLSGHTMITLGQTSSSSVIRGDAAYSFKEEYTMADIDIPILVSYRIPVSKTSHIRFNAGPVLSAGVSSKLDFSGKTNSERMQEYPVVNGVVGNIPYPGFASSHLNWTGSFDLFSKTAEVTEQTSDGGNGYIKHDSRFDAAPFSRMNFGLRFGAGYEYMGISLDISYQWIVSNSASDKFWGGDRWMLFNHGGQLMKGYAQHNNLLVVSLGYTFRY